jgi:hypothetical protein
MLRRADVGKTRMTLTLENWVLRYGFGFAVAAGLGLIAFAFVI